MNNNNNSHNINNFNDSCDFNDFNNIQDIHDICDVCDVNDSVDNVHPAHSVPGTWAVVPAGGNSSRFGPDKLLMMVSGKPILLHTVTALLENSHIEGLVLAAAPENIVQYQDILGKIPSKKTILLVPGGNTRRTSVMAAVAATPKHTRYVLIHDAARPLLSQQLINTTLQSLQQHPNWVGVVAALPVTDTLKAQQLETNPAEAAIIAETLDRRLLWRAQTPQVFVKKTLLAAHQQVPVHAEITDDAQLIEQAGLGTVGLVMGDPRNLKLTYPEDLALVRVYFESVRSDCI